MHASRLDRRVGNLSGECRTSILDHRLQLNCERYLSVGATQIPTGELRAVAGTAFDLRAARLLGEVVPLVDGGGQPGLDHCFEVVQGPSCSTALPLVAILTHEASGRQLLVHGSQPGVQVYTANFLCGAPPETQHNAVCLETQHFPDAINQPAFASVLLRPGERYAQRTVFSFRAV